MLVFYNKSSKREARRLNILSAVKNVSDIAATIPISIMSISVLNNQNSTFLNFVEEREESDNDNLWACLKLLWHMLLRQVLINGRSYHSTINGKTEKPCNINVYHCKTCEKYFVNNEALQKYNSWSIYPLVRFTLENDFSGTFRPYSILSIYGYTVKEGELTGPQRHRILAYIVDSGVITKAEAVKTIQQFVHLNGKKAGNQNARKRWEEDIQFLSQYTKGNAGVVDGQFVYHNN